ncbi:MAG TPA: type II CRISPR RNA-guided endonuclease Cas9, partial [Flavobacterium sp.]|nr:type II CRISPR RNA-guided endonuclease Cas9 [Flavobacterium sp.]
MKSQKTLVGKCTFEPSKTKCPKSAIAYELFSVYQWVNTVECNGVKLTEDEREKVAQFLLRTEKCDFSRVRKLLGRESAQFKFNYKDQDKITGTHTISNLSSKKFFGESWFSFSEKEQEDIWHILYFFDSKTRLKEYAMNHWQFDASKADAIADFHLKDTYGSLSRKAIQHILPFLKQGFTYDTAVVLGGIRNVFGTRWDDLTEEQKRFLTDNVPDIISTRIKGGFIGAIRNMLEKEFGVTETPSRRLYHHSASIQVSEIRDFLPTGKQADAQIQSIRNPVVITALFELRTLINSLIKDYGPLDEIKIEMARDLKASRMQRNKMRNEQQRLERENDRVKKRLLEEGQRITHTNMLLYKLWEECKNTCPYTGQPIPLHKLFSGEVQIEHIHPWSRSLNDSFLNKTLCYTDENRRKGDRTPYEFYGGDEQNWSAVKERALKLFSDTKEYPNAYKKFQRFVQQQFDDDFASRQLNDTRYISREAKNYLTQVCSKVTVLPGQMTANLRQKWGLDNILNEANTKNRGDHRHHAIDALVVACGRVAHLQELSRWNSYNRSYDLREFPLPWPSFRFDAERATESLLVSHRQLLKTITVRHHVTHKNGKTYINKGIAARGQLHKEFSYGRRKPPGSENETYHIRKGVETIKSKKHIDNVVDSTIRELILKRVQELGGFTNDTIPSTTFFTTQDDGKRIPQLFLPNKNGSPVPILKVRMKETMNKAKQVRRDTNLFVNPRNNHHVVIFEQQNGKLDKEVISLWEVVERKKQGLPIVSLPVEGRRIIETFSINDMFLLYKKEEEINWVDPDYRELSEYLY